MQFRRINYSKICLCVQSEFVQFLCHWALILLIICVLDREIGSDRFGLAAVSLVHELSLLNG